jgi:hypothetical protein
MALKLNIGVSRKVGLPAYGSVGASCNLELEVESGLLDHDLQAFHARVRDVYVAAHQAVHDELTNSRHPPSSRHTARPPRQPTTQRTASRPAMVTPIVRRPGDPGCAGRPPTTRCGRSALSRAGSTPTSTGYSASTASLGPRTCRSCRRLS